MASATGWLWDRLHRPLDEVEVTRALLGYDEQTARHVVAHLLLDSSEARRLVEATPPLIRVLRNQQGTVLRTEPSIRGPVQWSATISHRAASGFQDDLYVCAMAVRDYDVPENRALAAALLALRRAGRSLDASAEPPDAHQGELRARARRAGKLASHPRLRGVSSARPSPRELAKVRGGPARGSYEPAVALLERAARGPSLADLEPLVDGRHRAHHTLLRLVVDELGRHGVEVEPFRTWRGQLFSGRVRYMPPRRRGVAAAAAGVALGDTVLTLADPGDRAGHDAAPAAAGHAGRRVVVVRDVDDVRSALASPAADLARR